MLDLPQDAYMSHQSPGRLRVKIPSKKGDQSYFSSLKGQLTEFPGIERIDLNPVTGSVLVIHSLNSERVSNFLENFHLYKGQSGENSSTVHQEATKVFHSVDRRVKEFTAGRFNLGSLSFLALVGAGVYQILRGNLAAIPWYSAFWYALSIFLKSKSDGGGLDDGE